MGEYSKRIGEVGEKVVIEFLDLIGWKDPIRNEDIESLDPEFRKKTNGIDGYFHYLNPMISGTVENVIFSTKYSTSKYPSSKLVAQFKERYSELAKVLESFKKSNLKQSTLDKHQNVDTHFDRGVLFWLNNSRDLDSDLITKLESIELNSETEHDGVLLVDNKRIEFIYDSIVFARYLYRDREVDFIYPVNGLNSNDTNLRNGSILPVEFINSSVLLLRAAKEKQTAILLTAIDTFDENDLMKYLGLAKSIGCNLQGQTIIGFPDYGPIQHDSAVRRVMQAFGDPSFTAGIEIKNYSNPVLQ